jgi:hypothetical protein
MSAFPNQSIAFSPTSRYYGIPIATFVDPNAASMDPAKAPGALHVYVRRRFIPPPDAFATLEIHVVTGGERYDTMAAKYIGDPLQFWRLADANGVMDPSDLEMAPAPALTNWPPPQPKTVRITLPAGIPGYPGD